MYYCLPVFLGGQRRLDESLPGEKYTVNIVCLVYDLLDRRMQVLSADSPVFLRWNFGFDSQVAEHIKRDEIYR